jgi:RNA polymerase sigma factor (TIGR02999 family)
LMLEMGGPRSGEGTVGDVTALLEQAHQGDVQARRELFEQVYAELRRLARQKLSRERGFTDLDVTSLVHEAYLALTPRQAIPGANRRMFFAYAASVMRSVIVDHVRKRSALKRGAAELHITLTTGDPREAAPTPNVEALDAALRELAQIDRRAHDIVEMRYFGGLSIEEVADALEVSVTSVKRDWQKARAFLYKALRTDADQSNGDPGRSRFESGARKA